MNSWCQIFTELFVSIVHLCTQMVFGTHSLHLRYCCFNSCLPSNSTATSWPSVELSCFLLTASCLMWLESVVRMQTWAAIQSFLLLCDTAVHLHPVSNFKPCSTFTEGCILARRLLPWQHPNGRRALWLHDNWLPPPLASFIVCPVVSEVADNQWGVLASVLFLWDFWLKTEVEI